jgi:hypothetical protein
MRCTGLALLAGAALLLLSGAAQAKAPPDGIEICGPNACAHLGLADAEQFWVRSHDSGRPVAAGPFYVFRWHWPGGADETAYLVPGGRAIRWRTTGAHAIRPSRVMSPDVTWTGVQTSAIALVKQAAAGVQPYPAPTLTRVTVAGREVRAPQTYLRLLRGKPTWLWPATPWLRVTLESAAPSPWTDGVTTVQLARVGSYVSIDSWVYRVPKSVAQRARRGLSLGR